MIQQFYLPTRILIGPGSINQVGQEAKSLGRRVMVVTYPDIRKLGFLDIILKIVQYNPDMGEKQHERKRIRMCRSKTA